jgi:Na+-driven multidrug efflux pump
MEEEKNSIIVKNSIMLYVRMIFVMLVTLYTSRVVLNVLGISDYGIYNVVGGIVTMVSFINGAMANGTQRFLSYELGNGNLKQLNKVFSTTLSIHILIGILILILTETFGLWFLNHKLNIPQDRLIAANWVYQFSILCFLVSIIQVPYNASLIAHEHMKVYAYLSFVEVAIKLIVVLVLSWSNFDKLILYGALYFIATFVISFIYRSYCKRKFEECRYNFEYDRKLFNNLLKFAGWNLYGNVTCVIADQGVNMVLNMFFGPVVNAARGIAYQINNTMRGFANNFQIAANPQIIKSYAAGEDDYMMNLVFKSSKFTFYLLFIIALPVFIEIDFILKIWLKIVPDYTALFCRLIIINNLIDVFSVSLQTASNASGKIKRYQFTEGTIILSVLPISYIFYKLGYAPETTFYVGITVATILQFARLYILKYTINLKMKSFLINVILRATVVAALSSIIPFLISNIVEIDQTLLFFIVSISCLISSIIFIYILGLNKTEKFFIRSKLIKMHII